MGRASAFIIGTAAFAIGAFLTLQKTDQDFRVQLEETTAHVSGLYNRASIPDLHLNVQQAQRHLSQMSGMVHGAFVRKAGIARAHASKMYSDFVKPRVNGFVEFVKVWVQTAINEICSAGSKLMDNERIQNWTQIRSTFENWTRIIAETVDACRTANTVEELPFGAFVAMFYGLVALVASLSRCRRKPAAADGPRSAMPESVLEIPTEATQFVMEELAPLAECSTVRHRRADSPAPRLESYTQARPEEPDVLESAVDTTLVVTQEPVAERKGASASAGRRRRTDSPASRVENDENVRPIIAGNGDLLYRLNTFSEQELQRISGLGAKSVQMLMKYRSSQGELHAVDDLVTKVGVRPSVMANFRRAQAF